MSDDALSVEDRLSAYETIIRGCWRLTLNMNDTLAFACADCEDMDAEDVEELIPLVAAHGHDALIAYACVRRSIETGTNVEPVFFPGWDYSGYQAARPLVEAMAADKTIMFDVKPRQDVTR